jgi:hypothetical protein
LHQQRQSFGLHSFPGWAVFCLQYFNYSHLAGRIRHYIRGMLFSFSLQCLILCRLCWNYILTVKAVGTKTESPSLQQRCTIMIQVPKGNLFFIVLLTVFWVYFNTFWNKTLLWWDLAELWMSGYRASDTVDSVGRQIKQRWIKYIKKIKKTTCLSVVQCYIFMCS